MLNETQLSDENSSDYRPPNPLQRKRSNSVGSKRSGNNDISQISDRRKNLQTYASSGNLFENSVPADTEALENLFVNWYKDPKSVRNILSRLHDNNIFKAGLPILDNSNNEGYYPPVIFLIGSNLKIDNDYEIYTINNYDLRISELMSWGDSNKKEFGDDYNKSLKAINQQIVDIANSDFDQDEQQKKFKEETKSNRRHSEIMGLMIVNKNQTISSFLPNKALNGFDVVDKVCDIHLTDQNRRTTERVVRHIILSNDVLSIFATKKAERLKYRFSLKHLYCGKCIDFQIPNIDSSLRIGGPYGDDLIITFTNPNIKTEWNTAIQKSISAALESIKAHTTEITILKNLELNSSAPLVSKIFSVDGKTTGLELKKKAIEGFNPSDKNTTDYILTFTLSGSNREYVLHDDVIVMILREHIACSGDSISCNESCFNVGNTNVISRHFYLKYNPSRDISRNRRQKVNPDLKSTKSKQYFLNEKWIDNVVPEWLMRLLSDVYHEGSQIEGIFRKSAVISKSDDILQTICSNGDNIEIKDDIHTKANVLKKFIGAIDGSIFTHGNKDKLIALSNEIVSVEEFNTNIEQMNKLLTIVQNLPRNNYHLLQLFLVVTDHIIKNEAVNKMSLSNLSTCLAPTVLTEIIETSTNDYFRIIKLFSCILSLSDKIVDVSVQKKLVTSLRERRTSIDSNSISTSVEETMSNNANVDSLLTSGSSDVVDEIDGINKLHPSVPPRRKKAEIEKMTTRNLQRVGAVKKPMLQDMRQSLSEELTTDCAIVTSHSRGTEPQTDAATDIVCENTKSPQLRVLRKKRHSRDRHTVAVTDDKLSNTDNMSHDNNSKTPDPLQSSPFRRQFPVNRKHRDHSMSNCKVNEEEVPKSAEQKTEIVKDTEKEESPQLQRTNNNNNNNRAQFDQESRSRDRTRVYRPAEKTNLARGKFVFNSRQQEELDFDGEHRRTSSSSRVKSIVDDYEKKAPPQTPQSPTDKKVERNLEIANQLSRSVITTTRQIRPRNTNIVGGPIRPTRGVIENSAVPVARRLLASVHRSNTIDFNLKEKLEKSEDKDVTFI